MYRISFIDILSAVNTTNLYIFIVILNGINNIDYVNMHMNVSLLEAPSNYQRHITMQINSQGIADKTSYLSYDITVS